jgi:hypothetical protein
MSLLTLETYLLMLSSVDDRSALPTEKLKYRDMLELMELRLQFKQDLKRLMEPGTAAH